MCLYMYVYVFACVIAWLCADSIDCIPQGVAMSPLREIFDMLLAMMRDLFIE